MNENRDLPALALQTVWFRPLEQMPVDPISSICDFTFMLLPLNSVNRQLGIPSYLNPFDSYSDSRNHGYQGSSRNVRLGRVIPSGGGALAKSDDGIRCAVTGKECR